MLSKMETMALKGIEGMAITVEADISMGLPCFTVIGLADTAVKESSERVRRAVINSGFKYPSGRITVNLSPAYIYKRGSHYDLGIALAILTASREVKEDRVKRLVAGELSLEGRVLPVRGALPMAAAAAATGYEELLLPEESCREAALAADGTGIKLIPVRTLREATAHIAGDRIDEYKGRKEAWERQDEPDFADVKGHRMAKAAIAAAMAGAHSILLMGAPGTGKTMMARRAPGLLPQMSLREQMETSAIYSAAGFLTEDMPVVNRRPFRQVGPGTTKAQLLGGGQAPGPGEISFAHHGLLFIDEFLELPKGLIDSLREPVEEGKISLVRRGQATVFPADFILIGAANPCRCGYLGDESNRCTCSRSEIEAYRSRLSGPMADRIDMCVETARLSYGEAEERESESTEELRRRVLAARQIQADRFSGLDIKTNGEMGPKEVERFCLMSRSAERLIRLTYERGGISCRRYHKLLKLARTLADMSGEEYVMEEHMASALQYTRLLRMRERTE